METHSSIFAWKILWTGESSGLQSMGLQESDMTQQLDHDHTLSMSLWGPASIRPVLLYLFTWTCKISSEPLIFLANELESYYLILQNLPGTWNWSFLILCIGLPCGSVAKNPPTNTGDVRDEGSILDQEDPLEKEMATHANIVAWEIP